MGMDEDLKKIEYTNKLENLDPVRKNKYRSVLRNLLDMGFLDFDRNLRTAERVGTDIVQVMEELSKPEVRQPMQPPMKLPNQVPIQQQPYPQLLQPQPLQPVVF